eukprot:m.1083027 g.1083027  ORF g.1083027 m.1083027 type:complete len:1160 (-) comp24268_c1_seq5:82-3561(-)
MRCVDVVLYAISIEWLGAELRSMSANYFRPTASSLSPSTVLQTQLRAPHNAGGGARGNHGNEGSSAAHVPCPSCSKSIALADINVHLDTCLAASSGSPPDRRSTTRRCTRKGKQRAHGNSVAAVVDVSDDDGDATATDPIAARTTSGMKQPTHAIGTQGVVAGSEPQNDDYDAGVANACASSGSHVVGSTTAGHTSATSIAHMRTILPDTVGTDDLRQLLDRARGSVEHAIALYFDQGLPTTADPMPHPGSENSTATVQTDSLLREGRTADTSPTRQDVSTSVLLATPSPSKKRKKQLSIMESFCRARQSPPAGLPNASPSRRSHTATASPRPSRESKRRKEDIPVSVPQQPVAEAHIQGASPDRIKTGESGYFLSYLHLSTTFKAIADIKGRIEIIRILTEAFVNILKASPRTENGTIDSRHIVAAVYLCSNRIAPEHHGIELSVGGSTVAQAVAEATGKSRAHLRAAYDACGDLGDVAQAAASSVRCLPFGRPKPLTIRHVYDRLWELARVHGRGAGAVRKGIIFKLFVACRGEEPRFLVRTLLQHLRTGAVGKMLQTAVAHAFRLHLLSRGDARDNIADKTTTNIADSDFGSHEDATLSASDASAALQECFSQHPVWENIIGSVLEGSRMHASSGGTCAYHAFAHMARACAPAPGIPIQPMLAKVSGNPTALVESLAGECFQADYKYDGMRAQLHLKADGTMRIFSRHLEDITERFPDVIAAYNTETTAHRHAVLGRWPRSFIADGEIVAYDYEKDVILPFQKLQSRPRKGVQINAASTLTAVKMVFYDLMSLEGTSLLQQPFNTRRKLMYWVFGGHLDDEMLCEHRCVLRGFGFARHQIYIPETTGHDTPRLRQHLRMSFEHHCEGLMIKVLGVSAAQVIRGDAQADVYEIMQKAWDRSSREILESIYRSTATSTAIATCTTDASLPFHTSQRGKDGKAPVSQEDGRRALGVVSRENATYEPAKRCNNWVKIKKDYMDGTDDTLDVVPLGAWWGNGRKAGWYSPFLLAVYDPETETFQSLCKIMSGFTDEFYKQQLKFYEDGGTLACKKDYYHVSDSLQPDVWFDRLQVWEIKGAELTHSPVHTAGLGLVHGEFHDRGISLRFPRFIRVRDDKLPEDATTAQQVADMIGLRNQRAPGHDIAPHHAQAVDAAIASD